MNSNKFNLINAYINGLIIIIVSLVVDQLVSFIGLESWSGFVSKMGEMGLLSAISDTNLISLVFLFIAYPLILGIALFWEKVKPENKSTIGSKDS